jgi:CubicO group peptidase (beta-lactamase class C family)
MRAASFPTAAFAAISDDPVTEESARKLQAALALHDVTGGGGMSATVMTAEGTWRGTTGKADGVRDLQVDGQFSVASITKSVVAAQVMQMVEAGELGLDDLVAEHLPGISSSTPIRRLSANCSATAVSSPTTTTCCRAVSRPTLSGSGPRPRYWSCCRPCGVLRGVLRVAPSPTQRPTTCCSDW